MTFKPKNPDQIGVAFLGVGRMALTHLQTLAGIRNPHVIVVADPDIDAARRGPGSPLAARATTDTTAGPPHPARRSHHGRAPKRRSGAPVPPLAGRGRRRPRRYFEVRGSRSTSAWRSSVLSKRRAVDR